MYHYEQGLRCVRMLETHPLLHGTYPIITLPWPGLWQVHTQNNFRIYIHFHDAPASEVGYKGSTFHK